VRLLWHSRENAVTVSVEDLHDSEPADVIGRGRGELS